MKKLKRPSGGSGNRGAAIDLREAIADLEKGRRLTRFTRKRPPQVRWFRVCLETRQLIAYKPGDERSDRVVVDLCEGREIRLGQNSKDFQKWPQEANDHRHELSLILFHGNDFVLKTFSVVASNAEEFQKLHEGLKYLVSDAQTAPYPIYLSRWLQKEFKALVSRSHLVSFKEVKTWFTKLGLKPGPKFKELYQEIEPSSGDINYDQVNRLYQLVIYQSNIFNEYFSQFLNGPNLTPEDFQVFLKYEQKEPFAVDSAKVKQHLLSYLNRSAPLSLTPQQFLDYLYSRHNEVCQLQEGVVTDDMTRPLSHYWISSSHNTYLTGDQITSESSCDAYVRALRAGCKCIELDCWDGDREPIIYHGHTLTSKILFRDVIETIRDHAWDVSDYPLILSIENHCGLPQQKMMADGFKRVFGDRLLKEPIRTSSDHLPSPQDLRGKIVLKHKKLRPGGGDTVSFVDEVAPDDMSQSRLSGLLYIQDPIDRMWKPHYFVLTTGKLLFTEETHLPPDSPELDEDDSPVTDQPWFHSSVSREETLQLLEKFGPQLADGAFLVRLRQGQPTRSDAEFSLSFWRQRKVNHCRITSSYGPDGQVKYSLIDTTKFDNLQNLITHYQSHPLHCKDFHQVLGRPIPVEGTSDPTEWYHDSLSRNDAYDMLSKIPFDGAFLIRKRDEEGSYAISFRAEGKIKHCRFNQDADGLFAVGNSVFDSLEDLVDYFRKHPLYRHVKLRYPTNKLLVARVGTDADDNLYASGYYYVNPAGFTSDVYARAIHDYAGRSETELSFKKEDIISNINKVYEDTWWRGDTRDKRQCWFPSSYVLELDAIPPDDSSLGALQEGEVILNGCSVVTVQKKDERFPCRFRITSPDGKSLEVATWSMEEAKNWGDAVRETVNQLATRTFTDKIMDQLSKKKKLALELSDLVVYCQTVDFDPRTPGPPEEMSSLVETKADKHCGRKHSQTFNQYNRRQFSRVYPKGKRIDSSNYDPTPMWVAGCQMVALNFQTPDMPMQLNHGRFQANGGCGYVLKPDFMSKSEYDPQKQHQLEGVEPLSISITVIGARHLPKRGRDIPSAFVEIDIHGCPYDCKFNKSSTSIKNANGLNPVWRESCVFDITNPDVSLIRFAALDSDIFGDPNFLGQATYPVRALRSGYRSVPLKNGYGEDIPLAALLVHVELGNPKEDYQDVYTTIQALQEEEDGLISRLEELKLRGETQQAQALEVRLGSMKRNLDAKKAERNDKIKQKKKKKVSQQKSR